MERVGLLRDCCWTVKGLLWDCCRTVVASGWEEEGTLAKDKGQWDRGSSWKEALISSPGADVCSHVSTNQGRAHVLCVSQISSLEQHTRTHSCKPEGCVHWRNAWQEQDVIEGTELFGSRSLKNALWTSLSDHLGCCWAGKTVGTPGESGELKVWLSRMTWI